MLVGSVPTAAAAGAQTAGSLRWRPCGGGLQCATLTVPRDDADPAGPTVDLALIRRPADDRDARIGSLLVNPGGPGASAVDFVRTSAWSLPDELLARFDIVGVDPRGSGRSDPVDCDYDLARYYALDFSPDDVEERNALVDGVQALVDACVAANGDYLRHVTTDATVRDMERVRVALGDERLTFLGFSYGTYLGAKYAEAHPDRVRALVLDGAVDPSIDARALQIEQSVGFEGVLDGFLRWCRRDGDCAFHRDGRTARAYDALRARVDRQGLAVPGTDPPRTLSQTELDMGVATILYSGAAGYAELGRALAAAADGDGRDIAGLADLYADRDADGTYGGINEAFLAISCADGPPVGTPDDVAAIAADAFAVAPRTGPTIVYNSLACALWPFVGPPARPVSAPTAPPIVVIGTRRDPATPFPWAESLARQLGSGVLISAPGAQHTAFGAGSACVDDAVVRYLVDLEVPEPTLVC